MAELSWRQEWEHQLRNLNRLMLWMLCAEEVDDDAALTAAIQLESWVRSVRRMLHAVKADEE